MLLQEVKTKQGQKMMKLAEVKSKARKPHWGSCFFLLNMMILVENNRLGPLMPLKYLDGQSSADPLWQPSK